MPDLTSTTCFLLGLLVAFYIVPAFVKARYSKLNFIPTVGPSGLLTSYIGASKTLFHMKDMVQEGYDKYYGRAFKIPMVSRWLVVVGGAKMIDELRKAPDDQLSALAALRETFQIDYTLGRRISDDSYHALSVRTPLTRSLGVRFPDVQDEIALSFEELVPVKGTDWIAVPAYKTVIQIICRTTNRLFVGLPLCRDPDYQNLNEQFTIDIVKAGLLIAQFPVVLRPIVARYLTNVEPSIQRAIAHLGPMIQDRLDKDAQFGQDWADRPNDMISWLLQYAQGDQRSVRDLALRVLAVNFAAIHTTSMGFTHVLYDLAVRPEYVEPLREEVNSVIESDGWSKVAIGKLRKLDSFIRESQRMAGTGAVIMMRKVLRDFTFSDGTTIPAGNFVAVASLSTHLDKVNYEEPDQFRGFRFADMREDEGESFKHSAVSLGLDWVTFGIGRHACPGRFFAVNEMKAMLAHVLLHYDVKMVEDGVRPADQWFGQSNMPNQQAKVMFRKRA